MMRAATRQLKYGNTRIAYRVRRSRRRRTVAITVDPVAGVVVTAPIDTSAGRLDGILGRKAPWILARLRAVGRMDGPLPTREFVSGESYVYLGRHYRLKVVPGDDSKGARLMGGWLHVEAPTKALADPAAFVRRAVKAWYRAHAQARLPERAALLAARLGATAPRVLVREQPKRWGSCDARGAIRINWRIIQAPTPLADYVLAHELVHLIEKNHTRNFWSLVGKVIPNYDRRRDELKQLGPRLVW